MRIRIRSFAAATSSLPAQNHTRFRNPTDSGTLEHKDYPEGVKGICPKKAPVLDLGRKIRNCRSRAVLYPSAPPPSSEIAMLRKLLLAAAFCVCCAVATSFAADEKKPPAKGKLGNLDKSKLFEQMDADKDSKVTKDEFKKFRETMAEKIKDKIPGGAGMLDKVFDSLFEKADADKDGIITKDEFEKYQPAGNLDPEQLKKLKEKLAEKKKG